MNKVFDYQYRTVANPTYIIEHLSIETTGSADDWYPKLFGKISGWLYRREYTTGDRIQQIYVYDHDRQLYSPNVNQVDCAYFTYTYDANHPQGQWSGQYPQNAVTGSGIYLTDIRQLCDTLRENPQYVAVVKPSGFTDHLYNLLYKDHYHDSDDKIICGEIRDREQTIKAIDDAINAFAILSKTNLRDVASGIPISYFQLTDDIVNRLTDAKVWVNNAVLTKRTI